MHVAMPKIILPTTSVWCLDPTEGNKTIVIL